MFLLWKQEKKRIVIWLPIIALLITTSDQFASGLCKPLFQRLRPCHEPSMFGLVHTVNGVCGGKFGFVSSHSANAFALAFFLARLFEVSIPKLRFWITLWASLQAYSRVYLGVHYPADVLVPIVFSFGFAWFWFTVGKKIIQQYCLT
ncbi:MAG: phosphatase PAP2 family protein [Bacteroidia bacterium]|nr:phosphatase PAP2 family protein [Bacteroidia bacterium]